jgi:4-amino-4-deoxy-L-arabinose transferase-like glycosyltransferase
LIYLFFFSHPLFVDYHEYTEIARNIAAGHGYVGTGFFHFYRSNSAFLQPVYTYLLAFFIRFFDLPHAFLGIRLFQVFINLLVCLTVYFVARELFDEKTGWLSALLFSVYLPFIYLTTFVWDTLIFSLLLLLIVWAAVKFTNRGFGQSVLLGLLLGLTALVNSVVIAVVPALLIYLYLRFRREGPEITTRLLLALLLAVVCLAPWSLRNGLVFKAFVPLRTGFWTNLYLGNNPDATGTIFLKHQGRVPADYNEGITLHFWPEMKDHLARVDEYRQDQYLKDKFFAFLRAQPGTFLRLLVKKIYYFIWVNPFEPKRLSWLLEYVLVLVLGLFGLYQAARDKKRIMLFVLIFISFVFIYALTGPFFNWKYRAPIEPYLIILAGYGLSKLIPSVTVTTLEA